MPQTRPTPARRRAASARAPRSTAAQASAQAARVTPASPGEKPRLDPNDVGVKRRARKRAVRRRNNLLAWVVVAGLSVVIGGAAAGVWSEYQSVQKKINSKQTTLSALRAQLDRGQRRVAALGTRQGKERALVEGGYLGPGERFLLFPKNKEGAKESR